MTKTSIIPYYILNLILIPTDECSYHPSSKKLIKQMKITTENYNGHDAEINRSLGAQSQRIYLYYCSCIYSSENITEGGQKDSKSQNTRKSAVKQSLLEMVA